MAMGPFHYPFVHGLMFSATPQTPQSPTLGVRVEFSWRLKDV